MNHRKIDDPVFRERFLMERKKASSARELSEALGLGLKTVQTYLRELGLAFPLGRPSKPASFKKLKGSLYKWMKSHPEVKLPHSVREISEITGLSKDTVKSSLYRQEQNIKKRLENLGDLRKLKGAIKTPQGIIPWKEITSYAFKFSIFEPEIKVIVSIGKKRAVIKTTLSKLEEYSKRSLTD